MGFGSPMWSKNRFFFTTNVKYLGLPQITQIHIAIIGMDGVWIAMFLLRNEN